MPQNADIQETVTLGIPAPPGGGPSIVGNAPAREYSVKANPLAEYVAGGYFAPLGDYVRTLPAWIDPVTRDFGLDIYERMVGTDPQVASCLEVYKAAVLADGWTIRPAQDTDEMTPTRPGQKPRRVSSPQAEEVADFCRFCLESLSTPFDLFLRQMLDATYQGHKVAEKIYKVQTGGKWAGRYVLDRIKPKPQTATAFVMDAYETLVGILGLLPNVPYSGMWPAYGFGVGNGLTLMPGADRGALQKDAPAILPRSKFAVLTWDGVDGSPQGRSMFRRIFSAWWWKENGYGIWGQLISKHADPSLIGTTALEAQPIPDPSGARDANGMPVLITPAQALASAMAGFKNGSYLALPPGATVTALQVNNTGEAIAKFMDWCNREIAKGILGQTLSTEEGKYGTKAQSSTHEATKDDVTRYGQVLLTRMVISDILTPLVLMNYGPGCESLVPEFGLGQEETMSFADFSAGVSTLTTSGYLHWSQYPAMDEMGGLPPRDEAAWMADIERGHHSEDPATDEKISGKAKFSEDVHWITLPGGRHIPLGSNGKPVSQKSESQTPEQSPSLSAKSILAKQSAKRVGADIQRYAEDRNEPQFARAVGGVSMPDNEPTDIEISHDGNVTHGIELKTMVDNKANKITMKTSAMARKADWMKQNNAPFHTVVYDDHAVFNAGGEGIHDDTKRKIFYRRGYGSFRVDTMHPVANMDELKTLLDTPDDALPKAAKPPKSYAPPSKNAP